MISFLICLALLIGGYFFGPDDRETPAVKKRRRGYVVLPQWKLFV